MEDEDNNSSEPISDENEKKVILYFANNEYVETGNDDLEHVWPEERT